MTILLMTGTLNPAKGARELARVNVADRIADYKKALKHNLGLLDQGVIAGLAFVENSGYGMQDFENIVSASGVGDRVDLMSYDARQSGEEPRFLGECKLLSHAFTRSDLIRNASDSHVWKITGRYIVRNLAAILRDSEGNNDLILHCRNYPMRYVDFGLVGFRSFLAQSIVARILGFGSLQDTDERAVRDMIDNGVFADMKIRQRFSHVPDFEGVRGVDNSSFGGVRQRFRYHLRSIVHKIAPRVWI